MGLDVDAYKNVVALGGPETDSDEVSADVRVRYADPEFFPNRCDEFPDGTPLEAEESWGFVAGGYGTYNRWREQLAKLAGYEKTMGRGILGYEETHQHGAIVAGSGPFYELIWFPDNEGSIGTAVCTKLAKDFAEFERAAELLEDHWFMEKYLDFKNAFELASEGGIVNFC